MTDVFILVNFQKIKSLLDQFITPETPCILILVCTRIPRLKVLGSKHSNVGKNIGADKHIYVCECTNVVVRPIQTKVPLLALEFLLYIPIQ